MLPVSLPVMGSSVCYHRCNFNTDLAHRIELGDAVRGSACAAQVIVLLGRRLLESH